MHFLLVLPLYFMARINFIHSIYNDFVFQSVLVRSE